MVRERRQGNSHSIRTASGGPALVGRSGSRKVSVKQGSPLTRLLYAKVQSSTRKVSSNSPIPKSNFPSSNDADTTSVVPMTERLTFGVSSLIRTWERFCDHSLNFPIASDAVGKMYALHARDFGFENADRVAADGEWSGFWMEHPARRILRETWNCLEQRFREFEAILSRNERRQLKLLLTIPQGSKRGQLTPPASRESAC